VIVVDASAAVLAVLNDGEARSLLAAESLASPHLVDSEVAHALRAHVLRGKIDITDGERAIKRWARLGIQRLAVVGLLDRMWELRANLTGYDATYVAVAEALGCTLLTADGRLARAPGPRCSVTVVRS
jgi:predicted nucleic acid-binding protein